jgi:transposase
LGTPRCLKDLIEEELFERRRDLFTEVDLVFFDTTSLYFEGRGGESIGKRGHNKDHRPDLYQMVVGMALDVEGRPICCEMWPGNTTDVKTLIPVVKRMRERFRLREITVVADRGMVSQATLEAFEKSDPPVRYIVGVRMRRQKEVNTSVLGSRARWFESVPERSNAKDPAPLKVKEVWVKEHRYIVCLNEEERRKDAHDREAIVAHLKEQLHRGDKSLVGNKGYRRYLKVEEAATSSLMKNKLKPRSATTASGCYGLTPSTIPRQWLTSIRRCGRSRTLSVRANRSLRPVPSTTSAMRLFEAMCFAVSWPCCSSKSSKAE